MTYTSKIDTARLDRDCWIYCETNKYRRSASGKSWVRIREGYSFERVEARNYYNTFDAVPFFRSLGGTERVEYSNSCAGYLPYRVSSVSPDGQSRTVRSFVFAIKARA